jgi:tetratricopeptide (TPR) repeat protein
LFLEGRDFWDDGRFVDAERKFREALAKYPRAEQADKTAFYFITCLIKLGRIDEARAEIQHFNRNYPQSDWKADVEETRIRLGGIPGTPFGPVYRIRAIQPMTIHPAPVPPPPPPHPGRATVNGNPLIAQEVFRVIINTDANYAINVARERLKANPSDPAIVSNFIMIAESGSPQALPFFVSVASEGPTPNMQTQARFWMGRLNNAEDAVGKAFIALTSAKTLPVVVNVLNQSNPGERNNVLKQVVQHPSQEKVIALEKVFKATTVQPFRSQILESAATVPELAALQFLTDVAKNETEYSVRLTAIQALGARKDGVRVLGDIMRTLPSEPAPLPGSTKKEEKVEPVRAQPAPRTRNTN